MVDFCLVLDGIVEKEPAEQLFIVNVRVPSPYGSYIVQECPSERSSFVEIAKVRVSHRQPSWKLGPNVTRCLRPSLNGAVIVMAQHMGYNRVTQVPIRMIGVKAERLSERPHRLLTLSRVGEVVRAIRQAIGIVWIKCIRPVKVRFGLVILAAKHVAPTQDDFCHMIGRIELGRLARQVQSQFMRLIERNAPTRI